MARQNIYEVIAGATIKLTWVNSGVTAAPICSTLRDKSDTLVSSVAATDSGNGHYYAVMQHPGSAQYVVNQWLAVINGNTYVDRQFGRVYTGEVD
jgi:hypothetical protein